MKQFTLEQITDILWDRHYLTRERFAHYFRTMYGFDERKIRDYYKIYERFPFWEQRSAEVMEDIVEKVSPLIEAIKSPPLDYSVTKESAEVKRQVHYKGVDGDAIVLDVNFNDAASVILYAGLLQSGLEIICVLDYVEKIHGRETGGETKDFPVYDGDIFVTADESYSSSSEDNVYVCDKGVYKRLLYTKGKGYMRKGHPDYDDGRYNSHVLTCCKSFKRLGNIYIDCSMLIDKENDEK